MFDKSLKKIFYIIFDEDGTRKIFKVATPMDPNQISDRMIIELNKTSSIREINFQFHN